MSVLEVLLLLLCGLVASVQAVLLYKLARAIRNHNPSLLDAGDCPCVLAVMCLRGTDPFLASSLRKLFTQDYPDYEVRVVVDSRTDPALQIVEEVRQEVGGDHVAILMLDTHDEYCSAKMSSLLLATEDLPEHTQIVATIDGDCMMHSSCLRELVTPLVREDVAVTTGNRWFAPPRPSLGGVARLMWNVGCVSVMHAARIPWGGCLAMQRGVIESPEVRNRYRHAFGEDTLLGSLMQQQGHRVKFVPQATIVNREDISLPGLYRFLTRQLLSVRLEHRNWGIIIGWGCVVAALLGIVCPLGLLLPSTRFACGLGLAMIVSSYVLLMPFTAFSLRKLVRRRGEDLLTWTPSSVSMMLLTAPLTQWLTLAASVRAVFARSITWRGLTYELGRDPKVRLVREVPVQVVCTASRQAGSGPGKRNTDEEAIPSDHSTVS